jgi:Yip1 domain
MASPPQPAATPPAPRRMSSAARLVGVFVSPGKTFADIAAEPHFILAWCVMAVAGLAFGYVVLHRVGALTLARQQLEASARGRALSPGQLDAAAATAAKFFSISFYASPATNIIFLCLFGALFLGIANFLLGYEANYKQALAVTTHAYLVQTVYALLMILVIALMPNPQNFQLANPMASNPGYFLDKATTSPFLYQLATRIDLFTFWTIILLAIGISKLGRKGKFSGAFWAVFSLWLFYALVVSGIAAAFA